MTNGFKLIGISTRTSNKDNQGLHDIGTLWARFYTENILAQIPNKISNDIYAIYTDYKSNYRDDYTTIIGVPVSSLDLIPDGFIGREFPAETLQKFTARGEMPGAIVETWMDIWQKDQELKRKYSYDFEVYSGKSQQGKNSEVDIFIALK